MINRSVEPSIMSGDPSSSSSSSCQHSSPCSPPSLAHCNCSTSSVYAHSTHVKVTQIDACRLNVTSSYSHSKTPSHTSSSHSSLHSVSYSFLCHALVLIVALLTLPPLTLTASSSPQHISTHTSNSHSSPASSTSSSPSSPSSPDLLVRYHDEFEMDHIESQDDPSHTHQQHHPNAHTMAAQQTSQTQSNNAPTPPTPSFNEFELDSFPSLYGDADSSFLPLEFDIASDFQNHHLQHIMSLTGISSECSTYPTPCFNNATCIQGIGTGNFTCQCLDGWGGTYCNQTLTYCTLNPSVCGSNGNCSSSSLSSYTCACNSPYTGTNCTQIIPRCQQAPNPCQNNGTCLQTSVINTQLYSCNCSSGYSGTNCTTSACSPSPCKNGATCELRGNSNFTCQCPYGFAGTYCNITQNYCAIFPSVCGLYGTCFSNSSSTYNCSCASNYRGDNCTVPAPICSWTPAVCQNGANCTQTSLVDDQQYQCNCSVGWSGTNCQTMINYCNATACMNGGTCQPIVNGFTCLCNSNYTGRFCERPTSACLNNLCNKAINSQCVAGLSNYTCLCPANWYGQYCDINITPCDSQPCQFGACSYNTSSTAYNCTCTPGYSGRNCDVLIDYCNPSPCLRGTCVQKTGDFACSCPNGYSGKNCEIAFNPCSVTNCNRGNCTALDVTSAVCTCPFGATGVDCSFPLSGCQYWNYPCLNGGICNDEPGFDVKYTCACGSGWTGADCSVSFYCSLTGTDAVCKNNGTCVPGGALGYSCTCPTGYTGSDCSSWTNQCSPSPCKNGGTCTNKFLSYQCTCATGYTGVNCTEVIDYCSNPPANPAGTPVWSGPNPCQNGGICTSLTNLADFSCTCPSGWGGKICNLQATSCSPNPCANKGSCADALDSNGNVIRNATTGLVKPTCTCTKGWDPSTLCKSPLPFCSNATICGYGTCTPTVGSDGAPTYNCTCQNGFAAPNCLTCVPGRGPGNGNCSQPTAAWPVLQNSKVTTTLKSIAVQFSEATNRPGLTDGSPIIACSSILSSDTLFIVGMDAVCVWQSSSSLGNTLLSPLPGKEVNPLAYPPTVSCPAPANGVPAVGQETWDTTQADQLLILLGANFTLTVDDVITTLPGILRSCNSYSDPAPAQSITITPPDNPPDIVAKTYIPPITLGCDSVTVHDDGSVGGAGRPLFFFWRMESDASTNLTPLQIKLINDVLQYIRTPYAVIDSFYLPPSRNFTINMTVTTWLGTKQTVLRKIVKGPHVEIPFINLNITSYYVNRSESLVIDGDAFMTSEECRGHSLMAWNWVIVSQPGGWFLDKFQAKSRKLSIAPNTLIPSSTYIIILNVTSSILDQTTWSTKTVSITVAPVPIPQALECYLDTSFSIIWIEFDMPTDHAGMLRSDGCDRVLTENTLRLFRESARKILTDCYWVTDMKLAVSWEIQSTDKSFPINIGLGTQFELKSNAIRSYDTFSAYMSAVILPLAGPKNLIYLPVPIITGSTKISSCDSLQLDSSASTGNAFKQFSVYRWSLVSSTRTPVSDALLATLSTPSQVSGSTLGLSNLAGDTTYVFSLALTNWLGFSANTTVSIQVDSRPIPSVSVTGGPVRTATYYDTLKFYADARAACGRTSSSLVVQWQLLSPTGLSWSIPTGILLDVKAQPYQQDTVYTFQVLVSDLVQNTANSANLTLTIQPVLPPAITSTRFSDATTRLSIFFNVDTNQQLGFVDCFSLFRPSTVYTFAEFDSYGQAANPPTCAWLDYKQISVKLGSGATILPYDLLELNPTLRIKTADGVSPVMPIIGSFQLKQTPIVDEVAHNQAKIRFHKEGLARASKYSKPLFSPYFKHSPIIDHSHHSSFHSDAVSVDLSNPLVVLPPLNPQAPLPNIQGPAAISVCEDLVLNAGVSSGFAGRPFASVLWSLVPNPYNQLSPTDYLYFNEMLANTTSLVLTIPGGVLPHLRNYTFQLDLTNWVGASNSSSLIVWISDLAIPNVYFQDATYRTHTIDQPFYANTLLSKSKCDTSNQQLIYTWSVISPSNFIIPNYTVSSTNLYFRPWTLESNRQYHFQVRVSLLGIDAGNVADVVVDTLAIDFVPLLANSNATVTTSFVSLVGYLKIDASPSYDFESRTYYGVDFHGPVTYIFGCVWLRRQTNCFPTGGLPPYNSSSPLWLIPPSYLADTSTAGKDGTPDAYVFFVRIIFGGRAGYASACIPYLNDASSSSKSSFTSVEKIMSQPTLTPPFPSLHHKSLSARKSFSLIHPKALRRAYHTSAFSTAMSNTLALTYLLSIEPLPMIHPLPQEKFTLLANIPTNDDYNITWSMGTPNLNLTDPTIRTTDLHSPNIVIREYVLIPGATYQFVCTIVSATKVKAKQLQANITVTIASSPSSGTCSVTPNPGTPLVDKFVFSCEQWTDDDPASALLYSLSAETLDPITGEVMSETALSLYQGANSIVIPFMSLPDPTSNSNETHLVARIKNSAGAVTEFRFSTVVHMPSDEIVQKELSLNANSSVQVALADAINKGDFNIFSTAMHFMQSLLAHHPDVMTVALNHLIDHLANLHDSPAGGSESRIQSETTAVAAHAEMVSYICNDHSLLDSETLDKCFELTNHHIESLKTHTDSLTVTPEMSYHVLTSSYQVLLSDNKGAQQNNTGIHLYNLLVNGTLNTYLADAVHYYNVSYHPNLNDLLNPVPLPAFSDFAAIPYNQNWWSFLDTIEQALFVVIVSTPTDSYGLGPFQRDMMRYAKAKLAKARDRLDSSQSNLAALAAGSSRDTVVGEDPLVHADASGSLAMASGKVDASQANGNAFGVTVNNACKQNNDTTSNSESTGFNTTAFFPRRRSQNLYRYHKLLAAHIQKFWPQSRAYSNVQRTYRTPYRQFVTYSVASSANASSLNGTNSTYWNDTCSSVVSNSIALPLGGLSNGTNNSLVDSSATLHIHFAVLADNPLVWAEINGTDRSKSGLVSMDIFDMSEYVASTAKAAGSTQSILTGTGRPGDPLTGTAPPQPRKLVLKNLKHNFTIKIANARPWNYAKSRPICRWYDRSIKKYSTVGCHFDNVTSTPSMTVCLCNHLTDFNLGSPEDLLAPKINLLTLDDLMNFTWQNVQDHPMVFLTLLVVYGCYFIILPFVHSLDQKRFFEIWNEEANTELQRHEVYLETGILMTDAELFELTMRQRESEVRKALASGDLNLDASWNTAEEKPVSKIGPTAEEVAKSNNLARFGGSGAAQPMQALSAYEQAIKDHQDAQDKEWEVRKDKEINKKLKFKSTASVGDYPAPPIPYGGEFSTAYNTAPPPPAKLTSIAPSRNTRIMTSQYQGASGFASQYNNLMPAPGRSEVAVDQGSWKTPQEFEEQENGLFGNPFSQPADNRVRSRRQLHSIVPNPPAAPPSPEAVPPPPMLTEMSGAPQPVKKNAVADHHEMLQDVRGKAKQKNVANMTAEEELKLFKNRPFMSRWAHRVSHNFKYEHLYVSILYRKKNDVLTATEKLTCVLCFLLGAMTVNAMFYQNAQTSIFGYISVALISAMGALPAKMMMRELFKRSGPVFEEKRNKFRNQYRKIIAAKIISDLNSTTISKEMLDRKLGLVNPTQEERELRLGRQETYAELLLNENAPEWKTTAYEDQDKVAVEDMTDEELLMLQEEVRKKEKAEKDGQDGKEAESDTDSNNTSKSINTHGSTSSSNNSSSSDLIKKKDEKNKEKEKEKEKEKKKTNKVADMSDEQSMKKSASFKEGNDNGISTPSKKSKEKLSAIEMMRKVEEKMAEKEREAELKAKKNKKPKRLPAWCRTFAMVLSVLWCVIMSVLMLLYGLKFDLNSEEKGQDGKTVAQTAQSTLWLLSSVISLSQDIFVSEPTVLVAKTGVLLAAGTIIAFFMRIFIQIKIATGMA